MSVCECEYGLCCKNLFSDNLRVPATKLMQELSAIRVWKFQYEPTEHSHPCMRNKTNRATSADELSVLL